MSSRPARAAPRPPAALQRPEGRGQGRGQEDIKDVREDRQDIRKDVRDLHQDGASCATTCIRSARRTGSKCSGTGGREPGSPRLQFMRPGGWWGREDDRGWSFPMRCCAGARPSATRRRLRSSWRAIRSARTARMVHRAECETRATCPRRPSSGSTRRRGASMGARNLDLVLPHPRQPVPRPPAQGPLVEALDA